MSAPAVSVVIPAFGRTEKLRKAVHSVLAQDLSPGAFELLVVDSSPDEANAEMLGELARSAQVEVRCLRKTAEGPGPSRNMGARAARGAVLAFLDSDCVATPGWLAAGLAAFADPEVGLVQGRTTPEPGVPRGTFSDYIHVESESFLYETANIFYRSAAFTACGGFPAERDLDARKDKPMGGEDVDLGWKVKRAGWKSRFAPEALVHHEVVPIGAWRWLYNKRLFIFPRFLRDYPEVRRFLFGRYFFDRAQAALALLLVGAALAPLSPWTLLLALPYLAARGSERTEKLRGPLRLVRADLYLPKDLVSMAVLVAGSLRFRSLLL
jgi:glycosyltransferase involved in cell wall biosynthesis